MQRNNNAPIHRNKAFQKKIAEWQQKKLSIFWLPIYSPQLNLIETLWRFMKYEWIEVEGRRGFPAMTNRIDLLKKSYTLAGKI